MRNGINTLARIYYQLRAQPRNLIAIGILISIVSLGPSTGRWPVSAGASADSQALISLYADGHQHLFSTSAGTVGEALRQAGITLAAGDLVEPSASSPVPAGPFNINVYRARPVLVQDGQRTYYVTSAYQSPRLLALAAGLIVYPEDRFNTQVVTNIVSDSAVGEKVTVDRATPLNIKVDGQDKLVRTQSATVAGALADAGISLGAQDTVTAPLTSPVVPGMSVDITRVTEAVVTITQPIARPVKTISDPTILKGQTTVKQAGSDGQKTITYRIHYHDGVETAREALQLVSQTDPVPQIVVVGTKVYFAGSVEYWRPQVEAAAAVWNIDPNMMLRIMSCESHGNATDVNPTTVAGEHATGLFQYLPSTWRSAGGTDDNIFDGSVQIQLTAKKMARYGTGAWACK